MGFIDTLKERAKANVKTIVLPETEDKRTLAATEKILKEGIAKVSLLVTKKLLKRVQLKTDMIFPAHRS